MLEGLDGRSIKSYYCFGYGVIDPCQSCLSLKVSQCFSDENMSKITLSNLSVIDNEILPVHFRVSSFSFSFY